MMKRGKLVTMTRMPGAIDRIVSRPKVRMSQLATEPWIGVLRMSGVVVCASVSPAMPGRMINRMRAAMAVVANFRIIGLEMS